MTTIKLELELCTATTICECDNDWAEAMAQLFFAESDMSFNDTLDRATELVAELSKVNCGEDLQSIFKEWDGSKVFFTFTDEDGRTICQTPVISCCSELCEQLDGLLGEQRADGSFEGNW